MCNKERCKTTLLPDFSLITRQRLWPLSSRKRSVNIRLADIKRLLSDAVLLTCSLNVYLFRNTDMISVEIWHQKSPGRNKVCYNNSSHLTLQTAVKVLLFLLLDSFTSKSPIWIPSLKIMCFNSWKMFIMHIYPTAKPNVCHC